MVEGLASVRVDSVGLKCEFTSIPIFIEYLSNAEVLTDGNRDKVTDGCGCGQRLDGAGVGRDGSNRSRGGSDWRDTGRVKFFVDCKKRPCR